MANAVNVFELPDNPDLKRSMEEVCAEMGLFYDNIHGFRQKVSLEHRIPFEVSADRSTRSNINHLRDRPRHRYRKSQAHWHD